MTTSSHLERRGGMGGKTHPCEVPSAIVASFTVFGDVFCDNAVVLPTTSDSKLNRPICWLEWGRRFPLFR